MNSSKYVDEASRYLSALCVENQTGDPIFLANVIVQRLWEKGQVIAV